MQNLRIFINIKRLSWLLAAVFGLILFQSASAEGLNGTFHHAIPTGSASIIGIRTADGISTTGVSAWHIAPRQNTPEQLAPKAKIIDVRAASVSPACSDQNGVCIVRLHPDGSL